MHGSSSQAQRQNSAPSSKTQAPKKNSKMHTSSTQAPKQNSAHASSTQTPQQNSAHNSSTQAPKQNSAHASSTQTPQQNSAHNSSTQAPKQNSAHTSSTQIPQQNSAHTSATQAPEQNSKPQAANMQMHIPKSKAGKENTPREYICPICNLHMATRQALFKHKRRQHTTELEDSQTPQIPRCVCQLCPDFKCITIQQLVAHYQSERDQDLQIRTQTFNTEEEFHAWKTKTEKDTSSQYVRNSGSKTFKEHATTSYYCHRSGEERPRVTETSERKR